VASNDDTKTPKKRGGTTGKRWRAKSSSTGKVVDVQADQTNWRQKLQQSRIKFDDPQKDVYVTELREHGLKGRAAEAAGVSPATVTKHASIDPDFSEALDEALGTYRDRISNHVNLAGTVGDLMPIFHKGVRVTEPILNEDGTHALNDKGEPRYQFAEVRQKNYQMLAMEAKRVEPSYREKTTIDLNQSGGGVLVAPAGVTPEEAVERNTELNAESEKAHHARMDEVKAAKAKVGGPKT